MKNINITCCGFLVLIFCSCSKSSNNDANTVVNNMVNTPANLVITPTVSSDNTGIVAFAVSATNASSYNFSFGDGGTATIASGTVSYKYAVSGTYTVTVFAKSSTGQSISQTTNVTVVVSLSLAWSDEFNKPGPPDTNKWAYDIGTGVNGWGNNELEYYTNRTDNAVINDTTLNIIAKRENYSGSNYTSAKLVSYGKFSYQYGYLEARAQLPGGVGTWPAIWMLGDNISTVGWPGCGEMDIMEANANNPNTIYGTLHYIGGNPGSTTTVQNPSTAFHLYGLAWSSSKIQILVDNVVYFTFSNTGNLPFNKSFYIILNVAIGGTFGGTVDPGFASATMKIDYVRVYR